MNDKKKDLTEITIFSYDSKCEDHSKIKQINYIRKSYISIFFFIILIILSLGLILFVMSWFPFLKYIFFYKKCKREEAYKVMIIDEENEYHYIDLYKNKSNTKFLFEFKLFRYFQIEYDAYDMISFQPSVNSKEDFINKYSAGLTSERIEKKEFKYGKCNLNFEIKSFLKLLLIEVSDPFYLFQIGAILLWFNNYYEKYATVILVTSALSLLISAYETRSNLLKIQKISKYSIDVTVIRNGERINIPSEELVPGDIFFPPTEGNLIPADACLIKGSIICNEALLTGESTPVIKEHLINDKESSFSLSEIEKHVIFSGTKVIQRRGICKAVVISTGFNTEKGNLIRSILYPKKLKVKFQSESVKYIILMGILGFVGYSFNVYFMIQIGELSALQIVLKFLDLITIVVPPALPACLAIGISLASKKLKSQGIQCIEKTRINMAGQINLISFDKTGTLTEDSLEIIGFKQNTLTGNGFSFSSIDVDTYNLSSYVYRKVKESKETYFNMESEMKDYHTFFNLNKLKEDYNTDKQNVYDFSHKNLLMDRLFIESLATCHTLTKIDDKLLGDPIDVEMFNKSNWDFINEEEKVENEDEEKKERISVKPKEEKGLSDKLNFDENSMIEKEENRIIKTHYEINIVRRFNFSSKLQRMSVICKNSIDSDFHIVFTKGSPEKIRELCIKETYPKNYEEVLTSYTSKGYRVLGISAKLLKISNFTALTIDRKELESNMIFLGLIIVQNKLKPQTIPTLQKLNQCKIKMVMATGDNILTAVAVSKESSLVDASANIYACSLETDDKRKEYLKWEVVKDSKINQDEEDFLNDLNETYRNVADEVSSSNQDSKRNSNVDFKKSFVRKKTSFVETNILDSSIAKHNSQGKSSFLHIENYSDLKKYYRYLDMIYEDTSESLNNDNIINNSNAEDNKESKTNQPDENSNYQHLLNDHIHINDSPFEDNLQSKHEEVIVTNGYTFEKIYNLNNEFIRTGHDNLKIYAETLRIILRRGRVFARMSPEHKTLLVEAYQKEGFNVLMCGDGANDCGALKAANVGVSLSQEEASIAAPFTSINPDISCLIILFNECKSSLVTSFQCFKFMIFYSIIQFISIIILNSNDSYLQDNQFLSSDLFLIFPIAILIERTEASKNLTKHLPTSSLLSFYMIFSIATNTLIFILFQILSFFLLTKQGFYDADQDYCGFNPSGENEPLPCSLNTAVFLVSNFQYFIGLFTIIIIKNFKKPFYSNVYLMGFLVLTMGYSIFMIIKRDPFSISIVGLVDFEDWFYNVYVILLVFGNFIVCLCIEFGVNRPVSLLWRNWKLKKQMKNVLNENENLSLCEIHQTMSGVIA